MALILSDGFPFPAMGLVHVRNSITQYRPISEREQLNVKMSVVYPATRPTRRSSTTKRAPCIATTAAATRPCAIVWPTSATNRHVVHSSIAVRLYTKVGRAPVNVCVTKTRVMA